MKIYKATFANGRENYIFAKRTLEALREAIRIQIQEKTKLVNVKPLPDAKTHFGRSYKEN